MLTVRSGRIAGVVSFNDGDLLARFGLPDTLPSSSDLRHDRPAIYNRDPTPS